MKSAKATVEWSLNIDCPHCGREHDLSQDDDDGIISKAIFNNKWEELAGTQIECSKCRLTFFIEEVEY